MIKAIQTNSFLEICCLSQLPGYLSFKEMASNLAKDKTGYCVMSKEEWVLAEMAGTFPLFTESRHGFLINSFGSHFHLTTVKPSKQLPVWLLVLMLQHLYYNSKMSSHIADTFYKAQTIIPPLVVNLDNMIFSPWPWLLGTTTLTYNNTKRKERAN